jgi:hypothetical protein
MLPIFWWKKNPDKMYYAVKANVYGRYKVNFVDLFIYLAKL